MHGILTQEHRIASTDSPVAGSGPSVDVRRVVVSHRLAVDGETHDGGVQLSGRGVSGPAPVRRAKSLHLDVSVEVSASDIAAWDQVEGEVHSIEEIGAYLRSPRARLRRVLGWPAQRTRDAARHLALRRQRAVRGWTDRDLWNLDVHLCDHLGSMLVAQVDEIRNHPPELDYEEWRAQVRRAGDALVAYDPDDSERVADARSALRWVAHNLVDLWD
jgi:hypothetical protein